MSETIIKLPVDKFAYLKVKEWPPSKYKIPSLNKELVKKWIINPEFENAPISFLSNDFTIIKVGPKPKIPLE